MRRTMPQFVFIKENLLPYSGSQPSQPEYKSATPLEEAVSWNKG